MTEAIVARTSADVARVGRLAVIPFIRLRSGLGRSHWYALNLLPTMIRFPKRERGCGVIRRYRRYLHLIDRKSRVWFHVIEKEVSMTPATVTERRTEQPTDKAAIRSFRFEAPEAELIELRRRITATRFP